MNKTSYLISGIALCIIGATTGLISLSLNVWHGLQVSIVWALIFFLAEWGRIAIPAVASLRGWNKGFIVILTVCGITSIYAALSNFADINAQQLLKVEAQNGNAARAEGEFARLRAELASITETAFPADLEALVAAHKTKASDEAGRGFCGPRCQKAETEATATMAKLAQARRKAELEGKLAVMETELKTAKTVTVSGISLLIASFTGANAEKVSMYEGLFAGLLVIVLIESLVYLPIKGFQWLLIGLGKVEEAPEVPASAEVIPLVSREAETLERLLTMIRRAEEGGIYGSGRGLAKQLGVSDSTFASWLAKWAKDGKIKVVEINAHKKRFTLAA